MDIRPPSPGLRAMEERNPGLVFAQNREHLALHADFFTADFFTAVFFATGLAAVFFATGLAADFFRLTDSGALTAGAEHALSLD